MDRFSNISCCSGDRRSCEEDVELLVRPRLTDALVTSLDAYGRRGVQQKA